MPLIVAGLLGNDGPLGARRSHRMALDARSRLRQVHDCFSLFYDGMA